MLKSESRSTHQIHVVSVSTAFLTATRLVAVASHHPNLEGANHGFIHFAQTQSTPIQQHPEFFQLETVSAAARDTAGTLAAATSTGSFPLKLPGRIGESPSIRSGNYADNFAGASSATGVGEIAIRMVMAKTVCSFIESGKSAQELWINQSDSLTNGYQDATTKWAYSQSIINGRIGAAHSSPNLTWAYVGVERGYPVASLTAKFVK